MSANIREMGIDIPGQVTRTYDKDSNTTSLVVDAEQALHLQATIQTVVQAFRLLGQLPAEPARAKVSDNVTQLQSAVAPEAENKKGQNG